MDKQYRPTFGNGIFRNNIRMWDVRCGRCNKLLCKTSAVIEIVCPRCHYIVNYAAPSVENDLLKRVKERDHAYMAKRLGESTSSDLFVISECVNDCLYALWEASKKVGVPADILFEKTVPLVDGTFAISIGTVSHRPYRCRVLVYEDVIQGMSETDTEPGEEIVVGVARLYLFDPRIFHKEVIITVPIIVIYGSSSIVIPVRDIEACIIPYYDGDSIEVPISIVKSIFVSCMKTWYGTQVALLHPEVKYVLRKQRQTVVDKHLNELTEEDYKEERRRNTQTTYRHIKRVVIEEDNLQRAVYGKTVTGRMKRKARLWRVCGHWRVLKSGSETFIQSYWKGPDRDKDFKIMEERERELQISDDAKKIINKQIRKEVMSND